MENEYNDIENLEKKTNQLYDEQLNLQKEIVNTGTQQVIDELERNKKKAEEEAAKTNKALYTDYKKQINPYGVNAENLAEQGLGKSGLAETTKANYYNTYQNARAEATSNANTIKADFDAQIAQARQNGDLQTAQAAFDIYKQKIQDMYTAYNLKFQEDQFNYTKEQDALTQSNWEKEYNQALQQALWEQQFNKEQFEYQKQQDEIAQQNWEKEYALSKKNSTGSRSSSSSKKSSSSNVLNVGDDTGNTNTKIEPTYEEIMSNIGYLQGTGTIDKPIVDRLTGKKYSTIEELLSSYGYALMND